MGRGNDKIWVWLVWAFFDGQIAYFEYASLETM